MDTHYVVKMNKLTLLDLVMPNMSDFELYQKIRMLDDKVKICFLKINQLICWYSWQGERSYWFKDHSIWTNQSNIDIDSNEL